MASMEYYRSSFLLKLVKHVKHVRIVNHVTCSNITYMANEHIQLPLFYFGRVTNIYEHYNKQNPKSDICYVISPIPTRAKYRECRKQPFYDHIFIYV